MSTSWTDLDTELSETATTATTATTAAAVDRHPNERPVNEHPVTAPPAAVEQLLTEPPDVDVDVNVDAALGSDGDDDPGAGLDAGLDESPAVGLGEGLVDEAAPAEGDFGLDLPQDRLGVALLFAALAMTGVVLGVFATPVPVVIAGWVVAVLGGLMAFRELAGGDAR